MVWRRSVLALFVSSAMLAPAVAQQGKTLPGPEPAPPVVGHAQPWRLVPDPPAPDATGRALWTDAVHVPGASFVKLHVVGLDLRPGDELLLRSGSGRVVDTLVGRGPKDAGTFWSLSAFGDTLFLELRTNHEYPRPPFTIDRVLTGLPDLFGQGAGGYESVCSPADFEDVVCYQADAPKWSNVLASVGVMSVGGNPDVALFCSGSNVSPQNYVLTNDHCIGSQASCDSSEFVFRYYATGCENGSPPTLDWVSFRCDEIVASSPFLSCDQGLADLDFALCSVIGDPASTFGFVTPDPVPLTDGEAIYIVQHPAGRPHEIAHGSGPDVDVDGTVLRYYDTLDTEGGSSGSPIFRESDHKLVGLHHCGGCSTPGVGNRGMLMSDIYPHIAPFVCSETLALQAVPPQGLAEVYGNGDALLDPGETWSFVPGVRNGSCDVDATGVSITFAPGASATAPLVVLDPVAPVGDVPAGQTAYATQPVRVRVSALAACGEVVALDASSIDEAGGSFAGAPDLLVREVGELPFFPVLSTDFTSTVGWTIDDLGTGTGPASTWTTGNPGNRSLPLTAPFFIADSDALGSGQTMDESLLGPVVDCSGHTRVELRFAHDFRWYSGGLDEQADVDVRSSATGGAWVNVANFSGASASGTVLLDLSPWAAGQDDVQVRFHYHNALFEWWWAVDDVTVQGSEGHVCDQGSFVVLGGACGPGPGDPELAAVGSTTGGGEIALLGEHLLTRGRSMVIVSSGVENVLGGCSPGVTLPALVVFGLDVDGDGTASLTVALPPGLTPGQHFYLQYAGRDPTGVAFSDVIEMLVE